MITGETGAGMTRESTVGEVGAEMTVGSGGGIATGKGTDQGRDLAQDGAAMRPVRLVRIMRVGGAAGGTNIEIRPTTAIETTAGTGTHAAGASIAVRMSVIGGATAGKSQSQTQRPLHLVRPHHAVR